MVPRSEWLPPLTHFEWLVGSPTRRQIFSRKSDNTLSALEIEDNFVKSKSDNALSNLGRPLEMNAPPLTWGGGKLAAALAGHGNRQRR